MTLPSQKIKTTLSQRLAMTQALQQSLEMLRMPQIELAQWLQREIEQNPLMEEVSKKAACIPLPDLPAPFDFYEYLLSQIREAFPIDAQRRVAEKLLERLDEKGFIQSPEELSQHINEPLSAIEAVLPILQTFDPPGIFAKDLRESLLLQLKSESEAQILVRDHFQDFLHKRFSLIEKKLGPEAMRKAIDKLSRLIACPITRKDSIEPLSVFPDLKMDYEDGRWKIEIDEQELPLFEIRSDYGSLKPTDPEEAEVLHHWLSSAKWILRSLKRRKQILLKTGKLLIQIQKDYLILKGKLLPLTLQQAAAQLNIHESTLSRALSGKYAATPRGLIPIRSLITSSCEADEAKKALATLIDEEDKSNPLTDDQLALLLKSKGFTLARRTVAKYRAALHIGAATTRKHIPSS